MTVSELLAPVSHTDILAHSTDFELSLPCTGVCRDARRVQPGELFFCVRGTSFDGHTAIADAVRGGAAAAVLSDPAYTAHCPLPWILVRDTRTAYLPALLASRGDPHSGMQFFAVTGTNGKTSVAYLLDAILSQSAAYAPTACFGTVENRIGGEALTASRTTPSPEELASLLCRAKEHSVRTVILEASSHALVQGRLAGLRFVCGIFTNLTEDHLDYHKSMENYYRAKRSLFFSCGKALINADDPQCRRILADPAIPAEKYAFTLSNTPASAFRVCATLQESGTHITLITPNGYIPLSSPLTGSFSAYNITAAAAAAVLAGVPTDVIQRGIASLPRIPGRMERIVRTPFSVYIDYAHTPDALQRAVCSARETTEHRVLLLFGCGGDREHEKRPQMGRIGAEYADLCVITSDNSRTEEPADIILEILRGVPKKPHADILVIEDRKAAIEAVLSAAAPGDTVLLCGKGHEAYQEDRTGIRPFSEKEIVLRYFKDLDHEN